jgi:benzoyl-CoA reductase/2-hydroxyglutaryl-CoA dehydratase subunit BcrC/BadD/HgdB
MKNILKIASEIRIAVGPDDRKELKSLQYHLNMIEKNIDYLELYSDTEHLQSKINDEVEGIIKVLKAMKKKYSLKVNI